MRSVAFDQSVMLLLSLESATTVTKMSSGNADIGTFTTTGGSQSDSESEVELLSPCHFSSPENALSVRRLSNEANDRRLFKALDQAIGYRPSSLGVAGGAANYPVFDAASSSLMQRAKKGEVEKKSSFASVFGSVPRSFTKPFGISSTEEEEELIVVKAVVSPPDTKQVVHLDEDIDYFNCPAFDVPASPVTPKGLTKKQREKTNALNALVMDWRECGGVLPSVRGFEPFSCGCEDTKTKMKAKMAVRPTMRGDLIISRSKQVGVRSKFWFKDVPEELGGKLRSFVCTSWGMKLDRNNKPVYFEKPGRRVGVKKCLPVPIDVGSFDEAGKLLSFRLNTPVRHFWMTPEGKKVGKERVVDGKKVAKKEKSEGEKVGKKRKAEGVVGA